MEEKRWRGIEEAVRIPSTTLYRHVRRPEYILVSECIDKNNGWRTAWGKLVHLSEKEMREHGLEIVIEDLKDFGSRDSAYGSEITGNTPEKKKARRKLGEYWSVSIVLQSNGQLELQPMQDIGKGRAIGRPEDRSDLQLPCSPEQFFGALNTAFNKCRVVQGG